MTNLGVMYANGFGVKQDQDEAARWYRLGGRQGPTALDQIAYAYDSRLAPLSAQSQTAHLAAANGGDPLAAFLLGYMWINLAAASGLAEAVAVRDAVAAHMTPAQVNGAQQLASRRWRESNQP